jgi:rare lipoprotein A
MDKFRLVSIVILVASSLSACMTTGRYSQKHDSAPVRPPSQLEMLDATVTSEPVGRGNLPYKVFGKHYTPMQSRMPFSETGVASWYGKKFHGHLTSNGETYDMYAMSAAHKTLPLPSFVKVTNLANNKSVVVRVNDRGPFHQDRIIDLSYSAAYKIGVYDTGTAEVKIEVILPEQPQPQYLVALEGFDSLSEAQESSKGLSLLLNNPASTSSVESAHEVRFGPFKKEHEARTLLDKIKGLGYHEARIKTVN